MNHELAQKLIAMADEDTWVRAELAATGELYRGYAPRMAALQKRVLPLLTEAAQIGEAEPAQVAYLHDRICFFERRPQRYGTQFDWDENGVMSPWKLEDPVRVDEWRQSVGLGALSEKINEAREGTKKETPPDFTARQAEMKAWARSVGWIE